MAKARQEKGWNNAAWAETAGIVPNFLSQILCGTSRVGEKLARKMETHLEIPQRSLDHRGLDVDNLQTDLIDAKVLAEVLIETRAALLQHKMVWDDEQLCRLAARLYRIYQQEKKLPDFGQAVAMEKLRQE